MEVKNLCLFSKYLEKQGFAQLIISSVLDSWRSSSEFNQAITDKVVSLFDQKDGTIFVQIGYTKYLIIFENYYKQMENAYLKELWLKIWFAKETLNVTERTPIYKPIGESFYLDPSGMLFDESNKAYTGQHRAYQQALLGIFATSVINDAEACK